MSRRFVDWAADAQAGFVAHMGVDHGRGYVAVSQEFLHSANIISGFQQMSSKTVSEGVAARRFINRCGTHRVTNGILEIRSAK